MRILAELQVIDQQFMVGANQFKLDGKSLLLPSLLFIPPLDDSMIKLSHKLNQSVIV